MTAVVATPKSQSLAGRPAGNVSRGERAASRTAMIRAAASPDGRTDGAPTPFYDHLMSMIHATALENRRAPHNDDIDAAPLAAGYRRRIPYLIVCTASLMVAVAAGGAVIRSGVSQGAPPVVAADRAPEERSRVVGTATTADEPVERPLPAAEPAGLGPIGIEGKQTAEGGIGAGTVLAAKSDEPQVVTPVAGQPIENLGPGVETPGDGPTDARASTQAMRTDPTSPAADPTNEQPLPAAAPSSLAPASQTGSTVNDPAAIRIARVVSDVNMRAGPSNGQPVLATIPRGSSVDVIGCRQWCEVIFMGQRGWIYKGFIGTSPIPSGS